MFRHNFGFGRAAAEWSAEAAAVAAAKDREGAAASEVAEDGGFKRQWIAVWLSASALHNAQQASAIFAPKFVSSTMRNAVVMYLTGLIVVMQNAQYDGGGIYSRVHDTIMWFGRKGRRHVQR